jgi:hypothetical protein
VREAALRPEQLVHQPHGAPGGEREQEPEPDALGDPDRDAERVGGREPGPHREQVTHELAALDVAEVGHGAPHVRHAGEEQRRVG